MAAVSVTAIFTVARRPAGPAPARLTARAAAAPSSVAGGWWWPVCSSP